jgi:hypothetical protein
VKLTKEDGRPCARFEGGRLELVDGGAAYLAGRRRLSLPGLTELTGLPPGLKVRRLDASGCVNLAGLPEGLEVRHLKIGGCTGLTGLPAGLRCYEIDASSTGLRSLLADQTPTTPSGPAHRSPRQAG